MLKIGLGKDLHRLTKKRPFLLAGVKIPSKKGESGHSDGDVLAHAVIDAILGASCLGDIGEFFPPTDQKWKNANSMELLSLAYEKVKTKGFSIINIDCVITCDTPKILPYREQIRKALADALGLECESVFVKGKTNEGLGAIGKGKAVEALAVCLLEKAS